MSYPGLILGMMGGPLQLTLRACILPVLRTALYLNKTELLVACRPVCMYVCMYGPKSYRTSLFLSSECARTDLFDSYFPAAFGLRWLPMMELLKENL